MRNRLLKSRPHSGQKSPSVSSTRQDDKQSNPPAVTVVPAERASAETPRKPAPTSAPSTASHDRSESQSTPPTTSKGALNSAMSRTATSAPGATITTVSPAAASSSSSARPPNRMNSTIRTVTSFDDRPRYSEEDSSTDGTQSHSTTSRDSGFSSSLNSTASAASSSSNSAPSSTLLTTAAAAAVPTNGIPRKPSYNKLKLTATSTMPDGGSNGVDGTAPRAGRIEIPERESSLSAATTTNLPDPADGGAGGWDSAVGKAGLGKTGRVINRLVSDNEALKRELQIERLRAEESRQAARLLEDKLERVISDYESRLLEANVTKTLLARKERQVESLQDAVELERKRAADAGARERQWKDEMEMARDEAKRKVDEATQYAALCEGRYNAISSHWKEQGEEVKRAMARMRKEVEELVEERKKDDEKIETLRELCDQQDGNLRELRRQKEEIERQFERYKKEQEEGLKEIKRRADEREREQEKTLKEARDALDKLRWALNVKEKIPWAQ
ncbi:hypothetical protein VTJ83DRAFT_333 [Remersonia thermophila]|uniref:Uncharacterized protein n=1 Tax=Remersonia thermophila TaxID=72144 RepID=A0ABR4DMD4_9PEZI